MKTRLIFVIFLLLVFSGQALASDCLKTVDYQIDSAEPSYGQVWVEWQAKIKNNCEKSYYTLVRLNFKDADGERIHQSLTSIMVKNGDTASLTKRSLVDEAIYEQITDTDIEIDSEELPNEVQ